MDARYGISEKAGGSAPVGQTLPFSGRSSVRQPGPIPGAGGADGRVLARLTNRTAVWIWETSRQANFFAKCGEKCSASTLLAAVFLSVCRECRRFGLSQSSGCLKVPLMFRTGVCRWLSACLDERSASAGSGSLRPPPWIGATREPFRASFAPDPRNHALEALASITT